MANIGITNSRMLCKKLEGTALILDDIYKVTSTDKETGEIKYYVKAEATVPKCIEDYSKSSLTVKIPNAALTLTPEQLAEDEYEIIFKGLVLSFGKIINNKGDYYFRAESYETRITI